jgi:hypothetical protein
MKTLNDFLNEVGNPYLVFALGGISVAHGDRARARGLLKDAASELDKAKVERKKLLGYYGSDSEISYVTTCESAMNARLLEKRSKEKHFKKLCYEFVEIGGTREMIDELIEIITSEST